MIKLILTDLIMVLIFFITIIQLNAQDGDKSSSEDVITLGGSLGINAASYNVNGISPRDRDLRYSLSGGFNVKLLGIDFPFSLVVSEENSAFTQPSNQIGVSPNYKWMTFHAGWRSLNYSPFTLAGHTFLGGGIDLNPGNFRISAMYGRFNKATNGDSTLIYSIPTYERTGFAGKIGYGTSSNFLDIIILKAKDDASTLDSTQSMIKPEENMVIGLSGKLNFFSDLFFEMDISSSLYTNDTRADNMSESNTPQIFSSLKSIYDYNSASQLTTALQTSLAWRASSFGIKVSYKRIDPDFKSMGAYFIESDVENIVIAPNVKLFGRSLSLTGSLGLQRDNLYNTKSQESQRMIASASISFNKPDYGVDLRYSSYGITQYKGLNPLIDSLKIARVNNSYNGSVRTSFEVDSLVNTIILFGGFQTLNDLNSRTAKANQSDNYMANIAYQGNLTSSGLSFGLSLSYIQSITNGNEIQFMGPTAQIGKTFGELSINGSLSYQYQTINSVSTGATASVNLQTGYQINKHNSISMNLNILNSGDGTNIAPLFTEYRSNFGYVYNF